MRPDVDPGSGRHLAVHGEPLRFQEPELVPGRPRGDQERVRKDHTRRVRMRLRDPDRFPRLNEQGLVVLQGAKRADDRVVRLPVPRRLAGAAVDHEVLRPFRDVGIEVVHQHPQRRFLVPALARPVRSARGAHGFAGRTAFEPARRGSRLCFCHDFRHILSPAERGRRQNASIPARSAGAPDAIHSSSRSRS